VRIAHVTATLDRDGAGVRAVVEAISAAQAAEGHEVRVFGLATPTWTSGDAALWQGAPAEALETVGPAGLGVVPCLGARLASFDPDVVHLHGLWLLTGPVVRAWSRRTGRPFFISVHGMLARPALAVSKPRKCLAWALYQRRIVERARALIASSTAESEDIRAFGLRVPVEVVPNGVDIFDAPAETAAQPTVLSLGRLDPIKGLDHLLDAWAELEPNFPDWHLRIAGPARNGYERVLQARIDELGLSRVRIEGALYGPGRDRAMNEAALFALPSLSENFALTVAESLAVGTPVVASRGAPWARLDSEDCGRWVDIGVEPLRAGLAELMGLDLSALARMGRRGRKWMARDFAWPVIAARLVDIYVARSGREG